MYISKLLLPLHISMMRNSTTVCKSPYILISTWYSKAQTKGKITSFSLTASFPLSLGATFHKLVANVDMKLVQRWQFFSLYGQQTVKNWKKLFFCQYSYSTVSTDGWSVKTDKPAFIWGLQLMLNRIYHQYNTSILNTQVQRKPICY